MSRIWFCRTCGYEVNFKGRCHECGNKFASSPLAELAPGDEEDEVGYRLGEWSDASRGRLIVRLIERSVIHRFEDEELVIREQDEEKTDAIFAEFETGEIAETQPSVGEGGGSENPDEAPRAILDPAEERRLLEGVVRLRSGAVRLTKDPTDMHADTDVAQASGEIFYADSCPGLDDATWDAVGRVTRKLLGALGADEALDDEIKMQSDILVRLLSDDEALEASAPEAEESAPAGSETGQDDASGAAAETEPAEAEAWSADGESEDGDRPEAAPGVRTEADAAAESAEGDEDEFAKFAVGQAVGEGDAGEESPEETEPVDDGSESVYELPDWLPEQRVQLSILLEHEHIRHSWEDGDLVVPVADEDRAEELFSQVDGVDAEGDDEAKYHSLEELFAATSRLVADPNSAEKAADVERMCNGVGGPTPIGVPDGTWWSIRAKARRLAETIDTGGPLEDVFYQSSELRDLLKDLM